MREITGSAVDRSLDKRESMTRSATRTMRTCRSVQLPAVGLGKGLLWWIY